MLLLCARVLELAIVTVAPTGIEEAAASVEPAPAVGTPVAGTPASTTGVEARHASEARAATPEPAEPAVLPELRRRARLGGRHPTARAGERLRAYLSRPLSASARYLDHGVLQVAVGFGVPALYRVDLGLGLLDHVTLAASLHWLPGQAAPRIVPRAALAFVRHRLFEVGITYHQSLHPPVEADPESGVVPFEPRTQWILGAFTMGQSAFSAGFDAGVAHRRVVPSADPNLDPLAFEPRIDVAGGLHARVGTRRFGVAFQGELAGVEDTELAVEGVVDLRFGLFELRPRGGWRVR